MCSDLPSPTARTQTAAQRHRPFFPGTSGTPDAVSGSLSAPTTHLPTESPTAATSGWHPGNQALTPLCFHTPTLVPTGQKLHSDPRILGPVRPRVSTLSWGPHRPSAAEGKERRAVCRDAVCPWCPRVPGDTSVCSAPLQLAESCGREGPFLVSRLSQVLKETQPRQKGR